MDTGNLYLFVEKIFEKNLFYGILYYTIINNKNNYFL